MVGPEGNGTGMNEVVYDIVIKEELNEMNQTIWNTKVYGQCFILTKSTDTIVAWANAKCEGSMYELWKKKLHQYKWQNAIDINTEMKMNGRHSPNHCHEQFRWIAGSTKLFDKRKVINKHAINNRQTKVVKKTWLVDTIDKTKLHSPQVLIETK